MRYEKYKKSISPFLEEIPFHWKETYLSHAYSLSSDTGHTEEQLLSVFLDKGVVSYSSTDQKQVHKPSEDLPLIPTSEQEEIADYIEQETAKIDRAVPVLEKEIELLKEYCTRLISDVVTGQMDVRNVEVPEYTPEEDIAEEAPEEQEVEMDAD